MKNQWYYRSMSAELGPFGPSEMRQLVARGAIQRDTEVRKGLDGEWIAASFVKGLFSESAIRKVDRKSMDYVAGAQVSATIQDGNDPSANVSPIRMDTDTERRGVRGNADSQYGKRLNLYIAAVAACSLAVFGVAGYVVLRSSDQQNVDPAQLESSAGLASANHRPLTTEEIVEQSEDGVALVKGTQSTGTGFLVAKNLLVTNQHVIANELVNSLMIHFPSADKSSRGPIRAKLVLEDTRRDLAFLSVETALRPLSVASVYKFQRGQEVIVIGSPGIRDDLVLRNAISKGVMSTEVEIEGQPYFQLGISINPGNSGGPVLNRAGEVIGVVTLKATKQEGLGFCIPLAELLPQISKAVSVKPSDYALTDSTHRARVAFLATNTSASLYKMVMRAYSEAMGDALENRLTANQGLAIAQTNMKGKIAELSEKFPPPQSEVVSAISTDAVLSESIRQKFVDFWANYRELRGYVDDPRGSYNSYREKCSELSDNHDRLAESLRLLLGLPEDRR